MQWLIYILSFLWKIYIGIVFTVFAILLYPVFIFLLNIKKWKQKTFKVFVFWSWAMRIFCFYPVKKIINSPIPDGPYIVIANHTSYLDIFLMYSILPKHPFVFLGKSEILSYPLIGTFFKNLNVPVDRKSSD
jgi:1-acyl-sn-glycerol-3-phosphate acyltransferase